MKTMSLSKSNTNSLNEQGMVAIVVTTILMLVISLIVLGFTQAIRREQRQVLDQQLSAQAFYAAESGIKLAQNRIQQKIIAGQPIVKQDCGPDGASYLASDYVIDADTNANTSSEITCLLVKDELLTNEFQNVGMNSKVTQLNAKGGVAIDDILFSWQNSGTGSGNCTNYPNFPQNIAGWNCSQPLLRVDVVPLHNGSGLSQSTLQNEQFTAFLYPSISAATNLTDVPYTSGVNNSIGVKLQVNCTTSTPTEAAYACTARISGLNGLNSNSFGVRVMGIYHEAHVSISANAGGSRATLVGGQVVIDSTAKAVDVIRRLQARVSATGTIPDFAITSGGVGLCKQYRISGGAYENLGTLPLACQLP